jgi:hypothetical protein
VDRAALDHRVARLQVHRRVVELHVDLAGQDHDVVDRVRAVIASGEPGRELEDTKDRAVRDRRAELAPPHVLFAVVVGRPRVGRPHVADHRPGAALHDVLCDLVDLDDRLAVRVVAGDDSSYS